jgi:hypothetical protein
MELIGVGTAVLAESWLRAPRRLHAAIVAALTFAGLMTHISMLLAASGLFVLAGVRSDRDAWRWRVGIASGGLAWLLLWGTSFVEQARGGHSTWIPHTTPAGFLHTISALVTDQTGVSLLVVAVVVIGVVVCGNRDRTLGMVLVCCFVVPALLAGLLGLHAPVLLDRTLTVAAWGPLLALGYVIDAVARRARVLGVVAAAGAAATMITSVPLVMGPTGPTAALAQLERVARPGDVLAIQPPSKGVELYWTLGIRSDDGPARAIHVPGLGNAVVVALSAHKPSGRIWLMQISRQRIGIADYRTCAPTWNHGPTRMLCIQHAFANGFPSSSPLTITALDNVFAPSHRPTRVSAPHRR